MTILYTDIDPFAIEWINQLMEAGELPYGVALRGDINDLAPTQFIQYQQSHFFCGIGGWPLACKWAGISEDLRIFTGSPPCQPFSQSGEGKGTADPRHLWPAFFWHIKHCQPDLIIGEQVLSPLALEWWDKVAGDLEGAGYTPWAIALPASSVGAYHQRYRIYWCGIMANSHISSSLQGQIGRGLRWVEENQVFVQNQIFSQWGDIRWESWIDKRFRPIKRDICPVVDGVPDELGSDWHQCTKEARLQRIKGYGDAIVPQLGAVFLQIILGQESGYDADY